MVFDGASCEIQIRVMGAREPNDHMYFPNPDQKVLLFYNNRYHIDVKNQTTVTDLNRINFVNLFYSFIFQQSLIKICQLFPNYTVNYQNPYFIA